MRGRDHIEIGGVARAHGIRGEVVVVTHDPESQILGEVHDLLIAGVPHKVLRCRPTHRGWLLALDGVATRNDAELLAGKPVEVARASIPLDDGEVILDDLVGCDVRLLNGESWGKVVAIAVGFQDRLIIVDHGVSPPLERMLPVVDQFIVNIDLAVGVVTIDPPDGIPAYPVETK